MGYAPHQLCYRLVLSPLGFHPEEQDTLVHAHLFIAMSAPRAGLCDQPYLDHCNSFLTSYPVRTIHILQFI